MRLGDAFTCSARSGAIVITWTPDCRVPTSTLLGRFGSRSKLLEVGAHAGNDCAVRRDSQVVPPSTERPIAADPAAYSTCGWAGSIASANGAPAPDVAGQAVELHELPPSVVLMSVLSVVAYTT